MNKRKCPLCGLYTRSFRNHHWRDTELTCPYDVSSAVNHDMLPEEEEMRQMLKRAGFNETSRARRGGEA